MLLPFCCCPQKHPSYYVDCRPNQDCQSAVVHTLRSCCFLEWCLARNAAHVLPWASAIPIKHGIIDQTRNDASISTKVGSRAYCLYLSLVIPKCVLQLVAVEAEAVRQPGRDRANHRNGESSPFIDVHICARLVSVTRSTFSTTCYAMQAPKPPMSIK